MTQGHIYRRDIDGLRAVAVLSVVVFHAYPWMIPGGFTGVDIFFVISGYLICGIIFAGLSKGTFSFLDFYAKRIRRIFPALAVVVAATLLVGYRILLPEELASLGLHAAAGAGFVLNFVLAGEAGYFDQAAESKPLLHLWSLAVEEQFYIVWPLLAALLWRVRRSPTLMIWAVSAIIAASFVANVILTPADPGTAYYMPWVRFWQLMIGGLLAHIDFMKPGGAIGERPRLRSVVSMFGASSLTVGFVLGGEPYPGWWALLPTLGATALIAAGPGGIVNRLLLASWPAVAIGLISYPLYLWHWPLLTYARLSGLASQSVFVEAGAVLLSVLLASGTYWFIERPIRFGWLYRFARRPMPIVLFAALFGLGVAGMGAYRSGGWPERIPQNLRALAEFKYEYENDYHFNTCFIASDAEDVEFAPKCMSAPNPSIMLWGDSHSAHLRPGVEVLAAKLGYGVRQISLSCCVPSTGTAGQSAVCSPINAETFAQIKANPPTLLIVAGYWKNVYLPDFETTLNDLSSLGTSVVVIGPVPIWSATAPRVMFLDALRRGAEQPARRTWSERDLVVEPINESMEKLAVDAGIPYISALDMLCSSEGCEISTANGEPLQWDKEHFTRTGSMHFINLIEGAIRSAIR